LGLPSVAPGTPGSSVGAASGPPAQLRQSYDLRPPVATSHRTPRFEAGRETR